MQINNGGLDVYYIPSGKTTAFAKGFRMVAGSATNTDVSKVNGANICHRFVAQDIRSFILQKTSAFLKTSLCSGPGCGGGG